MKSHLLEEAGLNCYIAGAAYNFRAVTNIDHLEEDYEEAVAYVGTTAEHISSGTQVHGKRVLYTDQAGVYEATDGFITDKPGLALLVKFADCSPIALYDPEAGIQGLVHSGWRGTQQRIAAEAIRQMVDRGADVERIIAYVGPSIAQEDYEVGPEVYEAFEDFAGRDALFEPQGDKYFFNIMEANREVLLEAGLLPEHIELSKEHTFGNPALHSAREEGETYGLNAMLTAIPKEKPKYVQAVIQARNHQVATIKEADYYNLVVSGDVPQGVTPAQAIKELVQLKTDLSIQIFQQIGGPVINDAGREVYQYYARYTGEPQNTSRIQWVSVPEIKERLNAHYVEEFHMTWLPYIDRK